MIDIKNDSYLLKIGNMNIKGAKDYPVITHILKGLLEWHRNGIAAMNIIDDNGKYVLLLTEQQAYIIENSNWPRYKALNLDSETIINDLISDISEDINKWILFECESENEINEKSNQFKDLLSVIALYHKATNKGIDFKLINKAELKYADYLRANIRIS